MLGKHKLKTTFNSNAESGVKTKAADPNCKKKRVCFSFVLFHKHRNDKGCFQCSLHGPMKGILFCKEHNYT